eukprot:RCo007309
MAVYYTHSPYTFDGPIAVPAPANSLATLSQPGASAPPPWTPPHAPPVPTVPLFPNPSPDPSPHAVVVAGHSSPPPPPPPPPPPHVPTPPQWHHSWGTLAPPAFPMSGQPHQTSGQTTSHLGVALPPFPATGIQLPTSPSLPQASWEGLPRSILPMLDPTRRSPDPERSGGGASPPSASPGAGEGSEEGFAEEAEGAGPSEGGAAATDPRETSTCGHTSTWKRLRGKRGFGYYVCRTCGAKWKTTGGRR